MTFNNLVWQFSTSIDISWLFTWNHNIFNDFSWLLITFHDFSWLTLTFFYFSWPFRLLVYVVRLILVLISWIPASKNFLHCSLLKCCLTRSTSTWVTRPSFSYIVVKLTLLKLASSLRLVRPDSRLRLGLASPNSDSDSWAGLESKMSSKRQFFSHFYVIFSPLSWPIFSNF